MFLMNAGLPLLFLLFILHRTFDREPDLPSQAHGVLSTFTVLYASSAVCPIHAKPADSTPPKVLHNIRVYANAHQTALIHNLGRSANFCIPLILMCTSTIRANEHSADCVVAKLVIGNSVTTIPSIHNDCLGTLL